MELAQDRDRWRALVGTMRNLRVPKMRGISWLAAEQVSFWRRTLLQFSLNTFGGSLNSVTVIHFSSPVHIFTAILNSLRYGTACVAPTLQLHKLTKGDVILDKVRTDSVCLISVITSSPNSEESWLGNCCWCWSVISFFFHVYLQTLLS